jgi:CubicO group peptidase (beta-lactamase class C family)
VRRFARGPRRAHPLRQLAALGLARPRLYPPGTPGHTYYSNTNYVLLGMVVEAITGRSFAAELRRMLRGAGLRHTVYPGPRLLARIGEPVAHGYTLPLRAGGVKLLREYRRAFAPAPRIKSRVMPGAVQEVSSDPLAEGPTVEVSPAPPDLQQRYGGSTEVRRDDLTNAFSVGGSTGPAGAAVSNTSDLARFWRTLFSGELLAQRGLRLVRRSVPADPGPPGVSNYFTLGLARQDVGPNAFWPGSPELRIWLKLGDIWGYTSASYYVEGPAPYGDVVVTNTTNLFPSPVGDLGVLRQTLLALSSPARTSPPLGR